MNSKLTPRITLVIIAALFLVPLVLAWLMYTGSIGFQPETTRNKGLLIDPPLSVRKQLDVWRDPATGQTLAETLIHKQWTVIYPVADSCGPSCQERLVSLRQVHLASGRNRGRVRLIVPTGAAVSPGDRSVIQEIYPEFMIVDDPGNSLAASLQVAPSVPAEGGMTYLMDPLGNIMMAYAADFDPSDLKEDLKQLLAWSKLDEQS